MDIKLGKNEGKLDPELFNSIAKQTAQRIAGPVSESLFLRKLV